jgi:DNA-binding CsgD family transcriptional regulator
MMQARLTGPVMCPVFIGRVPDLTTLRLLVERAKSGQGYVALVSGEAGIGKSRLLAEVKTAAAFHNFLLLQGSCFPTDQAIPYAPLLDLLRSHFSKQPEAKPTYAVEPFIQAFLPFLPDLGHMLAAEIPPPMEPALDPEQEKRRRFEILAHFFTRLAEARPVLLVVEDLHWSDDTSLEFLHYLARRCSAYPLLLLLSSRSDEVRPSLRHFLAQLDRERLVQQCSLAPLTREEVEAMLRAIFALSLSARVELADPIYALTEGNPFFIEEMLTSLLASGQIFYADGSFGHKQLRELRIPQSVQDALRQRMDHLSEPSRRVLTLAAVAGRRFDFALLQQLTHYNEQHLLVLMKELIAAQFVVEESAEQFAFRHALTRQAVYADLLVRERKVLHRRIAETMERLYTATVLLDTHLADLADHFYEAGVWAKALEYGQRAGEQAQRLYTPRAAVEQATHALHAAQQGAIPPATALYRLRGQAYEILGDFERARGDYETMLQITRASGEHRDEWQALMDLGFLWTGRDYAQAGALYQQALVLARHLEDPITLAHSLNRLGNWYVNTEQPLQAVRFHQEALALFEQAYDQQGIAQTYDLLGMASCLGSDVLQGVTYFQRAVALFRELDNRQGLMSSLATLTAASGQYETETMVSAPISFAECLQMGEQALALAREVGQRSAEAYALLNLGQVLGPRGEYTRALEVAQEGLSLAEYIEHRQWMAYGHWELGVLYLDLLALSAAQQHLERALALAEEIGSWNWMLIVTGFLARLSLLQGDPIRAETLLNAVFSPDAPSQTIGQRILWDARASLSMARKNPGLALESIDRLIVSASNLSGKQVIPHLWKARGECLAALGRGTEAETMFQDARASAQAQGFRPLLWRIFLAQGHLYQTQARKTDADQAFASARTAIEELAAKLVDEELQSTFLSSALLLLPRSRPLTPHRAMKQAFGGLTKREREVARLVAQGKSNREIADLLVVGNRTVEAHVSGILSKLGFTSRAQIAVWACEKGLVQKPPGE